MEKQIIDFFRLIRNSEPFIYLNVVNFIASQDEGESYLSDYNKLEIRIARTILKFS